MSQVGNWLTFLGLAQFVQVQYGSAATAAAFAAQSLPSLLFVRAAVARIPPRRRPGAYYLTQFALAGLSLSLVIGTPLPYVLVFFALSALLRASPTRSTWRSWGNGCRPRTGRRSTSRSVRSAR